ncbi:MAG: GNAT family N-acetyltransferase [Thermoplasmata archaeon]|nr:GNAT family N-acetyltransferase [Thermoplasmata archaeon]
MRAGTFARTRLPLASARLLLRSPSLRDVPALVDELQDPGIARNLAHMPYPYRPRDGREWVRRAQGAARRGDRLSLLIVRSRDARVLGGVSVWPEGHDPSTLLLGYWLGRGHRGEGYATEAVRTILRAAFRRPATHRVVAYAFSPNRRSQALLRRVGFRREGLAREAFYKDHRWLDDVQFALLRREWEQFARDRRGS